MGKTKKDGMWIVLVVIMLIVCSGDVFGAEKIVERCGCACTDTTHCYWLTFRQDVFGSWPYCPNTMVVSCPLGTTCEPCSSGCYYPEESFCIAHDNDEDGYWTYSYIGLPPDCNDNDAAIHPGATETCDGKDNNCNGKTDYITTVGDLDNSCGADTQCRDYYCNEGTGCTYTNRPSTTQCGTDTSCSGYTGCSGACTRTGGTYTDYHCDGAGSCQGYPTGCSASCTAGTTCSAGSCVSTAEICTDSIDNNCNSLTDCEDANCNGQACAAGKICQSGNCVSTCTDECSSGQRQCSGTGYVECTEISGCWIWGPLNPCDDGNLCTTDSCSEGQCVYTPIACGQSQHCSEGSCVCDAGLTDCLGVCADISSDLSNCGSCGNICAFANAAALCAIGTCAMGSCNAGYYNLNNNPSDGCEYACSYAGEEICGNSIDEDCDGADLECPCMLTSAYWSAEKVSDKAVVALIAIGDGNCNGKTVTFDIWEDDFLPFEDLFDDDVIEDKTAEGLPLTATFTGNTAGVQWTALYTTHRPDGSTTETGQPEYYFKAVLADGTHINSGDLAVTGNLPPKAPVPFLIKPNGGEHYDKYADVTWNPASDPDDDPLEYKIEYSDDSGATWKEELIAEHYGHKDTVEYDGEEKESVVMDFG